MIFSLILSIAFVAVTGWALTRIIFKAGFSSAWMIAPVVPAALTIACAITTYSNFSGSPLGVPSRFFGWSMMNVLWHGGETSLGFVQMGLLWHIDLITIIANWVLILFLAVARWPSVGTGGRVVASKPVRVPRSRVKSTPAAAAPRGPRGVTRDYGRATEAAAAPVATAPAPSAPGPAVKHCAWCAEALPGSRALFHDCGPKTRPPVFCVKCGSTLTQVGDCPQCGATG
ncbi:MAG: hypothetical protein ACRDVC_08725 [Acidimicrobiales bacterium]